MAHDLPPQEAVKLGHCFYRHDFKWGIHDFEQWTKKAIEYARLSSTEKDNIRNYITYILDSADNASLSNAWHALGTAVAVVPPDLGGERAFLSTIRDHL
jgi:hypothetical protein